MPAVVICRQLKDRGYMTEDDHRLILVMLKWCLRNRFGHPMANFYLSDGPELVRRMNEQNADWSRLVPLNDEVLRLIRAGDIPRSALVYCNMINYCMEVYWGDCKNPFYAHANALVNEARTRLAAGQSIDEPLKTSPDL